MTSCRREDLPEGMKSLRKQKGMRSIAERQTGPAGSRNTSSIVRGGKGVCNVLDFFQRSEAENEEVLVYLSKQWGESYYLWTILWRKTVILFAFP